MVEFIIETGREGFIDVTSRVRQAVRQGKLQDGFCQVFVPHTTAAVTINENGDPAVVGDLLAALEAMVPALPYRHQEGNSPAHLKSSLLGCSLSVPVQGGALVLGTWQSIYLCEFDGPRQRKLFVQLAGERGC